ncbi:MAG: hypothetical protein ACI3VU_05415 [Faecousia sp.]
MFPMHFTLSDKYERMSKIEDTIEVVLSVLLCGLTFCDFDQLGWGQIKNPTLIIGLTSIILFAFTLVKQRLDHKKRSEQHYLAGKMYAHVKLEVDSRIKVWERQEIDEFEVVQYFQDNFSELNELVQIPEKDFIKLKHAHQTKVEFSKFLDTHKNDYLWICKLKFRFGRKVE